MNKEAVFSAEYEINNATDSKSSIQEKSSTPKDKENDDYIKKDESGYPLSSYQPSKPKRKLIRARIIPK